VDKKERCPELVEGEHDFGWALIFLRKGRDLTRKAWDNDTEFLRYNEGDPHIFHFADSWGKNSWRANHSDLLANDWEVVKNN